jgi:hypothetical protein
MKLLLPAIILFCLSCKQPKPKLTMADLKFADYEREFIAKNKVDSMYQIYNAKYFLDAIFPYKYDSLGRILAEGNGSFIQTGKRYVYDSLGFVIEEITRSDFTAKDFYTYKFDEDSNIVDQYIRYSKQNKDTIVKYRKYYFDNKGREVERWKPIMDINEKVNFYYDSKNRVVKIKTSLVGPAEVIKKMERNHLLPHNESISLIYYNKTGLIDSVITQFKHFYKGRNQSSKTYYDSLGLRYKTIEYDTIIINYKHVKRK